MENLSEENQISPDYVRISMAAAIELGLKPGTDIRLPLQLHQPSPELSPGMLCQLHLLRAGP